MIARRSSGVMRDQRAISSIERLQPVQTRVAGCTTQILTHGDSISSRTQVSSFKMSLFPLT